MIHVFPSKLMAPFMTICIRTQKMILILAEQKSFVSYNLLMTEFFSCSIFHFIMLLCYLGATDMYCLWCLFHKYLSLLVSSVFQSFCEVRLSESVLEFEKLQVNQKSQHYIKGAEATYSKGRWRKKDQKNL